MQQGPVWTDLSIKLAASWLQEAVTDKWQPTSRLPSDRGQSAAGCLSHALVTRRAHSHLQSVSHSDSPAWKPSTPPPTLIWTIFQDPGKKPTLSGKAFPDNPSHRQSLTMPLAPYWTGVFCFHLKGSSFSCSTGSPVLFGNPPCTSFIIYNIFHGTGQVIEPSKNTCWYIDFSSFFSEIHVR